MQGPTLERGPNTLWGQDARGCQWGGFSGLTPPCVQTCTGVAHVPRHVPMFRNKTPADVVAGPRATGAWASGQLRAPGPSGHQATALGGPFRASWLGSRHRGLHSPGRCLVGPSWGHPLPAHHCGGQGRVWLRRRTLGTSLRRGCWAGVPGVLMGPGWDGQPFDCLLSTGLLGGHCCGLLSPGRSLRPGPREGGRLAGMSRCGSSERSQGLLGVAGRSHILLSAGGRGGVEVSSQVPTGGLEPGHTSCQPDWVKLNPPCLWWVLQCSFGHSEMMPQLCRKKIIGCRQS